MKKILLLFFALWGAFISKAQNNDVEKNVGLQLVSSNRAAIGLSAEDLNNLIVKNSYYRDETKLRMVYAQQTFKGLPVYNQLLVLAFRNNVVVSNQGGLIPVQKMASNKSATPAQTAENAVRAAITEAKAIMPSGIVRLPGFTSTGKIDFGPMGIAYDNVTAELMWVPVEEAGKPTTVRLAWEIAIAPNKTDNYWHIRIDANTNEFISKNNLTDFDSWGHSSVAPMPELSSPLLSKTFGFLRGDDENPLQPTAGSPSLVGTANYLVIPYPAESPTVTGPTTVTNPWLLAGGTNATTLGWHNDGADYIISRGNNVWATEDRAAANQNTGTPATSTTSPDPLNFIFTPDFTQAPTVVANQRFATTNLFYWSNIIHDVTYNYGFDEASANFQTNNLGRGGVGNDNVSALAQSGAGTNNANFLTPADGGRGRMRMYLFNLGASNPNRDGDLDQSISVHEYGHGVSNRLTGGGSGACLGNLEEGGEGWSDYLALMLTQNWGATGLNDGFNVPRPCGLYALNGSNLFGGSPAGTGIRHYKYTTNMAINPWTYAGVASSGGEVHDIGEIWCAVLWDMTWEIIQQDGVINSNIFNAAGAGGNTKALKLVIEGMRLQKCNPGFLDARDAILQADQILYSGNYHCAIVRAFARRGMGLDAKQGSSNATNDQTVGFSAEESSLILNEDVIQQSEGSNIIYTNTVKAFCSALTNYLLTDTIPSNVEYVAGSATNGGTYDAGNRVVKWNVNLAIGATAQYQFIVKINPGTYFPPTDLINETVPAGFPATWTATTTVPVGGSPVWAVSTAESHSAPNSLFGVNAAISTDMRLTLNTAVPLGINPPILSFWHKYNTEDGWDGGVVEISTNGGANWTDLGTNMTVNGYNGTLGAGVGNNLANRNAFTGNSGANFIQTKVDLAPFASANALFRFRCASDDNTAITGWYVDDILLRSEALVKMRSSLFNGTSVKVHTSDTVAIILPPVAGCPTVTSQPVSTTTCNNSSVTFTGAAAGVGMNYQWEMSTTGVGGPWTNVPAAAPYTNTTTLSMTINPATLAMNGYVYRLKVTTAACPAGAVSNGATLTVVAASVGGNVTPSSTNVCGATNSGTLTLSGHTGNVVRWESSTTSAAGPWTPIANTTTTLTFNNIAATTYYRAIVLVPGCVEAPSSVATVNFTAANGITIVADNGTTLCAGDPTKLTVMESGGVVAATANCSSANTITALNSVSCGTAGVSTGINSYWRVYNLANYPAITGAYTINSVTFGIEQAQGTAQSFTINLYNQTGAAFPGGTRTLIGSQNVSVVAQASTLLNVPFTTPVTVPNTSTIIVEVAKNAAVAGQFFFMGSNAAAECGPSYLSAPACAINTPTTTAAIGFPNMHIISFLNGTVPGVGGIVTGGTFLWTPAAGLSSTTTNPVAASPATTTTYNVSHDNGAGCIRQASITITVNQRPAVPTPPVDKIGCAGTSITFSAVTSGTGTSLKWQVSTNGGGTWADVPNAAPYSNVTTNALTINPITNAMNGYQYRIVVSGICPPIANSSAATLTVVPLPVITVTPATACGGIPGVNGILLTASGASNYTWAPIAGLYTDAAATIPYAGGVTATVYAAPSTNTVYTVTGTSPTTGCIGTATATITYTPTTPVVSPAAATICLTPRTVVPLSITSVLASSTVSATSGTINLAVPDMTPNGVSSNLNIAGIPVGAVISNITVTLNMPHTYPGDMIFNLKAPAPSTKIINLYKYNGGNATGAVGNVVGAGWYNAKISSSVTTPAFSAVPAPFGYGVTTPTGPYSADKLNTPVVPLGFPFENPTGSVSNAAAWSELYDAANPPNGTWTLTMADGGTGDVGTLQSWGIDITYGPASLGVWTPSTGLYTDAAGTVPYTGTPLQTVYASPITTTTYSVTVSNGACPSPARTVVVTVNNPVAITAQPVNAVVCTDKVATFSVTATGTAPTYQWQVSTDNGNTFTNIANGGVYSGATTRILTITAPPVSMSTYQYRVVVGGAAPCGSVTSAVRSLTVNPVPVVTLTAIPTTKLLPGLTTTLTSTVAPFAAATYSWYRDGVLQTGVGAATRTIDIDLLGTYYVTVQDINGCVGTSNSVTISDSTSGRVFIYPNPNSGIFQVRYHSVLNNTNLPRGMNIYDDKGARVLMQAYTIAAPYGRMDVDMRKFGAGTYWVEVVDANGNRLAVGKVIILR